MAIRTSLRKLRPLEAAIMFLAVGVLVCLVLVIVALRGNAKTQAQNTAAAKAGEQAHTRQCRVLPASVKLYNDGLRRGVLSPEDYNNITGSIPALQCPGPPPPVLRP